MWDGSRIARLQVAPTDQQADVGWLIVQCMAATLGLGQFLICFVFGMLNCQAMSYIEWWVPAIKREFCHVTDTGSKPGSQFIC